ncbi:carboxylate-amine ligase [Streptomyces lavendofoliae]|uniref:carboxylate-amine ligase n=1 Tax=Streptomyces lavendofoliae TaxID=67314 RepID=UPI003D9061B1
MTQSLTKRPPALNGDGAGVTMGVEEEFLLIDRKTLQPTPRAGAVLRRVKEITTGPSGAVTTEVCQSQVESNTGICTSLSELREQVLAGRTRLSKAAAEQDAHLISVPLPVTAGPVPHVTDRPLYVTSHQRWKDTIADTEFCGTHIHIGVPDRETAVHVLNHITPWLPTLLAVTTNSPYHRGRDTGFASWRLITYTRLPCSGLPPWYPTLAHYEAEQQQLADTDIWAQGRGGLRLARLSAHWPTIEVRIGDACATVHEALLYAALTRGLVHTALRQLEKGRLAPPPDHSLCEAALWTAARHGLDRAIDPRSGTVLTGRRMLAALIEHINPSLEQLGDTATVKELVRLLTSHGTGADRQRHVTPQTPEAVLHMLTAQTLMNAAAPLLV